MPLRGRPIRQVPRVRTYTRGFRRHNQILLWITISGSDGHAAMSLNGARMEFGPQLVRLRIPANRFVGEQLDFAIACRKGFAQ